MRSPGDPEPQKLNPAHEDEAMRVGVKAACEACQRVAWTPRQQQAAVVSRAIEIPLSPTQPPAHTQRSSELTFTNQQVTARQWHRCATLLPTDRPLWNQACFVRWTRVRGQKKVCVPKSGLQFLVSLCQIVHSFLRNIRQGNSVAIGPVPQATQ